MKSFGRRQLLIGLPAIGLTIAGVKHVTPEWRRLLFITHGVELGITHLSFYTSNDSEHWTHYGDNSAYIDGEATNKLNSHPSIFEMSPSERYIGLTSDKYTNSHIMLFGPNGALMVPGVIRGGPKLPIISILVPPPSELVYWDVSGEYGPVVDTAPELMAS